jgi:Cft2 family RNA processing exonuclease
MRVFWRKGIVVQDGIKEVVLDPSRRTAGSVVSHAHMDHLTKDAVMTPETQDVMRVRLGTDAATPLPYGKEMDLNGFGVTLRDAGHVFGSAMIRVDDLLYTGDVNPEGGTTCGKAEPEACDVLVVESTYGKPHLTFPPKWAVEADLQSWVEAELAKGPVAVGAYAFGKGQEIVALLNRLGVEVAAARPIADIADVYRARGVPLAYRRMEDLGDDERRDPRAYVVPPRWIKDPPAAFRWFRGRKAYVSGWCAVFDFTRSYRLDAQFPLSDHADFDDLLAFVAACAPRQVYAVNGHTVPLAKAIRRKLGIPATPLNPKARKGG